MKKHLRDYFTLDEIINFRRIGQANAIKIENNPGGDKNNRLIITVAEQLSKRLPANYSNSYIFGMFCLSRIFFDGLKVIRLTTAQLEAMEQTNLNIAMEDYHQPFPTMILEYPEDYTEKRMVVNEHHSGDAYGTLVDDATGMVEHKKVDSTFEVRPAWCIVHHDPKEGFILSTMVAKNMNDDKRIDSFTMITSREQGQTIEECVADSNIKYNFGGTAQRMIIDVTRAAINACLLFDEFSFKKIINQKHYDKLVANVEKGKKRGDDARKKERSATELATLPEYYELSQEIVLHSVEREVSGDEEREGTGKHVKSHWRRGHRHTYWVGSERFGTRKKEIRRVAPILVNKRFWQGETGDSSVKYATRDPQAGIKEGSIE